MNDKCWNCKKEIKRRWQIKVLGSKIFCCNFCMNAFLDDFYRYELHDNDHRTRKELNDT